MSSATYVLLSDDSNEASAKYSTDPFKETAQKINVTIPEAVEEIDIGGRFL